MTGLQSEVAGVPFFLLDEGALENIKGHTEVIACLRFVSRVLWMGS